jgi:protocatechuate 3,4-dioxygenase, alpha subunit
MQDDRSATLPPATPSQTAGPFVSLGTEWIGAGSEPDKADPRAVVVVGSVLDGAGEAVVDAMLEFWQSTVVDGRSSATAPSWNGFARALTGPDGRYRLLTLKPGPLDGPGGSEAPHIDVSIFARGLLQRLVTRIYFADEEANGADPLLASLESQDVRARLLAVPSGDDEDAVLDGVPCYRFDIHLQGEQETVFFGPW